MCTTLCFAYLIPKPSEIFKNYLSAIGLLMLFVKYPQIMWYISASMFKSTHVGKHSINACNVICKYPFYNSTLVLQAVDVVEEEGAAGPEVVAFSKKPNL